MADSPDPARQAALAAMKDIGKGGYANLVVNQVLRNRRLSPRDAAFATELVYSTCRHLGTIDRIVEAASDRALSSLQPAVVDVLRLGAEQILRMRVPVHAGVASSVSLAGRQIGPRVTGVVNAILRRVGELDWEQWIDRLTSQMPPRRAVGVRTCHPDWIVEAYAQQLPAAELVAALEADNQVPAPTLVARPLLATREELLAGDASATPYSPWGVVSPGDPGENAAVRSGRAGVQDEGSQLVCAVLAAAEAPPGPWLDMCAGPGGKAALLTGLARQRGERLLAAELHQHRAKLVVDALRGYRSAPVLVADGRTPAWGRSFSRIMLDAPCSGLGALRRRPDARWRKSERDLVRLVALQRSLLRTACDSLVAGGVVTYVTCSPHRQETSEVVEAIVAETDAEILDAPGLLPAVKDARAGSDPRFIQLWPHRHNTDAMFCALLRKP